MPRWRDSSRCPGLQRCSKILCETIHQKLTEAVQAPVSSSIYNRKTTLAELTTAQSVILAIMSSLLAEDLEFCGLLLRMYSSVEQLRSSYLAIWLRDDFDFPEVEVIRLVNILEGVVQGGLLDIPVHVVRVFRGLAVKYGLMDQCDDSLKLLEKEESEYFTLVSDTVGKTRHSEEMSEHEDEPTELAETKKDLTRVKMVASGNQMASVHSEGIQYGPETCVAENTLLNEPINIPSTRLYNHCGNNIVLAKEKGNSSLHNTSKKGNYDHSPISIVRRKSGEISDKSRIIVRRRYSKNTDIQKASMFKGFQSFVNSSIIVTFSSFMKNVFQMDFSGLSELRASEIPKLRTVTHLIKNLIQQPTEIKKERICFADEESKTVECERNSVTRLHEAAWSGDIVRTENLLDVGVNVGSEDDLKRTPLHNASYNDQLEVVELHLKQGADVHAKDIYQKTALHLASWNGHVRICEKILEKGGDIEFRDYIGRTPLHHAVNGSSEKVVMFLIKSGANVEAEDDNGWTPLHKASVMDCFQVAEALVSSGANVMAKDLWGRTPLHRAADSGKIGIVKLLLNNGAQVEAKDVWLKTPLHLAAFSGHLDVVKEFLNHGASLQCRDSSGLTPLHEAAEGGQLDILSCIKTLNADLSPVDNYGRTPLHRAVDNDRLQAVKELLEAGVDPDIGDNWGRTAVHTAAYVARPEIVKVLIGHTKGISRQDKRGKTPLHLAVIRGHTGIVRTLLESGSRLDERDFLGRTALHEAADYGNAGTVSCLMEYGADPEEADDLWRTPLHLASSRGHLEVIMVLLGGGASINSRSLVETTALSCALSSGHAAVVEHLRASGAVE